MHRVTFIVKNFIAETSEVAEINKLYYLSDFFNKQDLKDLWDLFIVFFLSRRKGKKIIQKIVNYLYLVRHVCVVCYFIVCKESQQKNVFQDQSL